MVESLMIVEILVGILVPLGFPEAKAKHMKS